MKKFIKPYTPWSISFRRWAAKLRPDLPLDRYRHILDRLEHQRQLSGNVYAYIDINEFRRNKQYLSDDPNILCRQILPLYLRWLRDALAPDDSFRQTAIIAPRKRDAKDIIEQTYHILDFPRRQRAEQRLLHKAAGQARRSYNSLRGNTIFYCLALDSDLLSTRQHIDRFAALNRSVTPCFCRAPGSAIIIVGDTLRNPRTTFATMAATPPYPLPEPETSRPLILHDTGQIPGEDSEPPRGCGASSPTSCREGNLLPNHQTNPAALSC